MITKEEGVRTDCGWTQLHWKSILDQLEEVRTILVTKKNINTKDWWGLTPLHLAAEYGRDRIVQILLEFGANVNALDDSGKTPMDKIIWSKTEKALACASLLRQYGGKRSLDLN